MTFAPAPTLALSPPEVVLRRDEVSGGKRQLTLHARSTRAAACLRLWDGAHAQIRTWRVDGHPPIEYATQTHRSLGALQGAVQPEWSLDFCGAGPEGFVVEMEAVPGARLEIHAVDRSYDLPTSLIRQARGPGLLPSLSSDTTVVASRFAL